MPSDEVVYFVFGSGVEILELVQRTKFYDIQTVWCHHVYKSNWKTSSFFELDTRLNGPLTRPKIVRVHLHQSNANAKVEIFYYL